MNNQTHFPLPMIGLKLFLFKIPVGIIIFSHVLKPDKLEGRVSQMKFWKFFIHHEWTLLEPWNIYEYQVIEQNMNLGFLGTKYNKLSTTCCLLTWLAFVGSRLYCNINWPHVLCCDCIEGVAIKHNHIFYINLQLINKRHAQLDLTIYVFITLNIAHTVPYTSWRYIFYITQQILLKKERSEHVDISRKIWPVAEE